jgi:membrane protein CcdC involved in cytochrome C biogenesis
MWQGRTVLLSLMIGLAIGVLLTVLAVPALKYEVVDHANLLTRVLAYGFLLVPIAVITVLKSPFPVTHTTGLVAGATVVLATTAQTYTGTPMPYIWLAAATLFGCAAARIMKNERAATP